MKSEAIKKEMVSVRIPKKLNQEFGVYVKKLGLSKSAFILNIINRELEKNRMTLEKSKE